MSGQTINERYRIQKKLAVNAECPVYLVEDTHRFNEICIVKKYWQNPEEVKREAKILYQLDHPQIVSFRESFSLTEDGKEYTCLVVDYVEGLSYEELSQQKKLSIPETLERLKQIALLLEFLHNKGIVHGNLSLSSIIESNQDQRPILIDFSKSRQDPSVLSEDITALANMTLQLLGEKESVSPELSNLLEEMQQGKFKSASSLLKALETLELSPTTLLTEPTKLILPLDFTNNTSMASSIRNNSLFGCLSKIFLILGLSGTAGVIGWVAGNRWIESKRTIPQYSSDLIKKSETSNPSSPSSQPSPSSVTPTPEDNSLGDRLLSLKIADGNFFPLLVDQVFDSRYPDQKDQPKNSSTEKLRKQVANQILDNLSTLKPEVLENLGKYTETDLKHWTLEVNKLHLSSRSLYDLANGVFYSWFPEQEKQDFHSSPIGQIWSALVYSQLISLKAKDNYQKLSSVQTPLDGSLQPGTGKAYVVRLTGGKQLEVKLEPKDNLHFSIYSPTGKNNLLEDSTTGQWSGVLPETGYYEIVIVSRSKQVINYQLTINDTISP